MILSRRVKIQLLVFVLISALGIGYVGAAYVRISPLNPPYKVTAYFADSGGIFENAAVSVRGVEAGRVERLRVVPQGVAVDMLIQPGIKIPADGVQAKVANLSAVGEQYVDIVPQHRGGPYLRDGATIPKARTSTPIDDATILRNLYALAASVDRNHLGTVIDALGAAFRDLGPDLGNLISKGDKLSQAATDALPATTQLIDDSVTVLDTQRAIRSDLQTFAQRMASFSQQLVTDDPAIRQVFDNGVTSAQELQKLVQDNRSALGLLVANMVTLNGIQAARLPGLKVVLTLYPASVANGFLASPGDGTGHFGLVATDQAPLCTNGYLPQSKWRDNALDPKTHPEAFGGKAPLDVYCAEPHDSQVTVRGARNAPRPPGDDTAYPPGQAPGRATSSALTAGAPDQAAATYDPVSGLLFGPDGDPYFLGDTGGQERVLGPRSWTWLLLAPAAAN